MKGDDPTDSPGTVGNAAGAHTTSNRRVGKPSGDLQRSGSLGEGEFDMTLRTFAILAAAAGVVIVICEFESRAAMNQWDPTDVGRTPRLSQCLWPKEVDELSADEAALITVRVETPGSVRTYRYWVVPDQGELEHVLVPVGGDEGDEPALTAGEPE
jgi:hypothetical protein